MFDSDCQTSKVYPEHSNLPRFGPFSQVPSQMCNTIEFTEVHFHSLNKSCVQLGCLIHVKPA